MTVEFKYQTEDLVWLIHKGKAILCPIIKIYFEQYKQEKPEIKYSIFPDGKNSILVSESELFDSKEQLIASL